MASVFIDDAFTITSRFNAQGNHDSFDATHRIALPARANRYTYDAQQKPGDLHAINCALILEFVSEWDIKNAKGTVVPVSRASLDRIGIVAQRFLVDCVLGYGPEAIKMGDAEKN